MASASDWWSRALGGAPPAQQPPPVQQPVAPPAQQQTWATPGAHPPPQVSAVDQVNTGDAYMDVLGRAALATGGSKRMQEESGRCPECGSGNYFARNYTENGMKLRTPASPRCYDCGYPIVQAGSSRGGASLVRTEGPSRQARQLPKNHAVTVMDEGGPVTFKR